MALLKRPDVGRHLVELRTLPDDDPVDQRHTDDGHQAVASDQR